MRHLLRLAAVLAVTVAAVMATATLASADGGAFVGGSCLLGPPPGTEGHGGIVIAPNGNAVSHCVVPGSDTDLGLPTDVCFLYTAGAGEIVVARTAPNGTTVLVCSNTRP